MFFITDFEQVTYDWVTFKCDLGQPILICKLNEKNNQQMIGSQDRKKVVHFWYN